MYTSLGEAVALQSVQKNRIPNRPGIQTRPSLFALVTTALNIRIMRYIIKIHNILANYLFHIKTEKVLKKQYILRQN